MDSLYFRKEISDNKMCLTFILIILVAIIGINLVMCYNAIGIEKTQTEILKTQNEILKNQKEIIESQKELKAEIQKIELAAAKKLTTKTKTAKKEEPTILEKAGDTYNIDPKLLEAIERLESGHYTSNVYKSMNNSWGAMDGDDFMYFDSPDESTMALAKCLRTYYFDEGYDTIEKISKKYCPVNAEHWAEQVSAIYSEL